jgi:hypothetical protein
MPKRLLFLFILVSLIHATAGAQTIKGDIIDMGDRKPVTNVDIINIYTGVDILSDDGGAFFISAAKGQLLEFRKLGYKTTRVRIPQGDVPPYFKIIMQKGVNPQVPQYVAGGPRRYDYTEDSLRFHELYKHELDFPRMNTLDVIEHPFSALSKRSQEIWKFQDDYEYTEQQKYIDNTFNAKLITEITGLQGDSLQYYMKRYRPTYQQLHAMNDYAFYNYIKRSVETYRVRSRGTSRSTQ